VLASIQIPLIPRESLPQLLNVYRIVIARLPFLTDPHVVDEGSRFRSSRVSANFGSAALACAIAADDTELGLELIEQARAVFWAQALSVRYPDLELAPEPLRTQIAEVLSQLSSRDPTSARGLETSFDGRPSKWSLATGENDKKLQQLLGEVRALPGLDHFMLGPSCEMLMHCADAHPVVVLSADAEVCHALLLLPGDNAPIHIPLQGLKMSELAGMAIHIRDRGLRSRLADEDNDRKVGVSRRGNAEDHSLRILARIWRNVVEPIFHAMGLSVRRVICCELAATLNMRAQKQTGRDRPRLHWVPTGPFTFLPVHAAGIYSGAPETWEHCSQYVVSSYSPTLSALLRARKGLATQSCASQSMLAVAASQSPGMVSLSGVRDEVETVSALALSVDLNVVELGTGVAAASVADVVEALPTSSIVHLACHGVQDLRDPLQSRFCFGDGSLSVQELMRINTPRAFLAFLSACETAKGDEAQPDQSMHLAAAMLFCGFRSVIGTMWYGC
jgi:hypothetical protein